LYGAGGIATELSEPSRATQTCFHDTPTAPGIQAARPSSESANATAPVLTSVETPSMTGNGVPRVVKARGSKRTA